MNSKQSLSGEYLKKLYTENKLNDHLLTHENLKTLLNYELDNMGDTIDSNFDFEIIDFCVEKLKEMEPVDEQKLQFLGEKLALEARAIDQKEIKRNRKKRWIAAATVGIIAGGVLLTGKDGLAGKFDLVHRLIWEEKGEQLVTKSPDLELTSIEKEEGHLPDSLPDEFRFLKFEENLSSSFDFFNYTFIDNNKKRLYISIKKYHDDSVLFKEKNEINRDSSYTKDISNITYYYYSNYNKNSIFWIKNQQIYKIYGEYPLNKLEEIVSYYYEKDE